MAYTVRDVIKRASRLNGALATGDDPNADEVVDLTQTFNAMQRGFFGDIIGPRLSSLPAAASLTAEPGGLYAIAASAMTITAPNSPRSGARFGVADANLNFATATCTIARNGRLLEGAAANLTLTTAGTNRVWFYRGDTGGWEREADLTIDATIYFPDNLTAFLPDMLAVFAVAEYGGEVRPDVVAKATLGRQVFARTYARRGRNQSDQPLSAPVNAGS